ncbi:hypothetical protein D9758_001075 [Tetrapyrgos nigripes]|uniref:Mitochondrial carrier n=1 Tax=Tetrapyrgos nigripes TaxID=182062 RepID=A0A8H5GRH7_9AGAR|nr:hypothetical protein D9758_001075 [Tetrapyrgos nigripes]
MSDSAIHSAAGALGGIMAMTATYPLVFLSTRAAVKVQNETKSVVEAVKEILAREGIAGLYDGLSSSLLGIAVTNGVYYYFYERTRAEIILKSRAGSKGLSTLESILTGLIAGSATTIISNPIWVQTMNSEDEYATKRKPDGFYKTAINILAKAGLPGFWRGIGPALVLVINPVLQYTVFEQLKNFLVTRRRANSRLPGNALLTDWDFFVLGALSKLVATSASYPYIVVKSRLQAGQSEALKYKSSFGALSAIVREEGIEGLYKGMGSKLIQSVLTAAILFAGQRRIYELTKTAIASATKA